MKKTLFIILGIIPFIAGILLITLGIGIGSIFGSVCQSYVYISLPLVVAVPGFILFTVQIMGCCGIIKDNKFGTLFYIIFSVLFSFSMLILAIGLGVHKKTVEDVADQCIEATFKQYKSSNASQAVIDGIQHTLKCCGSNNSTDFGKSVPESCCIDQKIKECTSNSTNLFPIGCKQAIVAKSKSYFLAIFGAFVSVAVIVGILGIIATFAYKDISKRTRKCY